MVAIEIHSNAANSTATLPDGSPATQQINGNTVLWAMIALALTAMLQPSRLLEQCPSTRGMFEGMLNPMRASPVQCLLDAIGDGPKAVRVLRGWFNRPSHRGSDAAPGLPIDTALPSRSSASIALCMRVALFLLGTVPQAVKIFALKGIPVTQACAAMFLLAIVTSALTSFSNEPWPVKSRRNSRSGELAESWFETPIHLLLYTTVFTWLAVIQSILHSTGMCSEGTDCNRILQPIATQIDKYGWFALLVLTVLLALLATIVPHRLQYVSYWPMSRIVFPIVTLWTILLLILPDSLEELSAPGPIANMLFNELRFMVAAAGTPAILCLGLAWVMCRFAIFLGNLHAYLEGRVLLDADTTFQHADHEPEVAASADVVAPVPEEMDIAPIGQTPLWQIVVLRTLWQFLRFVYHVGSLLAWWITPQIVLEHLIKRLRTLQPVVICLAFGMYHLLTAVMFYTVAFDGTGTENPAWTSVLG